MPHQSGSVKQERLYPQKGKANQFYIEGGPALPQPPPKRGTHGPQGGGKRRGGVRMKPGPGY